MAICCLMTVFIHFVLDKQKLRRSAQSQEQDPVAVTPDNEASNSTGGGLSLRTECGVFVVAPCAHDGVCPMDKTGQWCHFSQRLERNSAQRITKVIPPDICTACFLHLLFCDPTYCTKGEVPGVNSCDIHARLFAKLCKLGSFLLSFTSISAGYFTSVLA
jgi:hypothetical protein